METENQEILCATCKDNLTYYFEDDVYECSFCEDTYCQHCYCTENPEDLRIPGIEYVDNERSEDDSEEQCCESCRKLIKNSRKLIEK